MWMQLFSGFQYCITVLSQYSCIVNAIYEPLFQSECVCVCLCLDRLSLSYVLASPSTSLFFPLSLCLNKGKVQRLAAGNSASRGAALKINQETIAAVFYSM